MPSTERSPRKRALLFGGGALVLLGAFGALLGLHKHHPVAGGVVAGTGAAMFALALVSPTAALAVRAGWMKFAAALGWVNSRIILGAFFFLVFTPIALVRRLFVRDPLSLRRGEAGASYWRPHEPKRDPAQYKKPW